MAAGNLLAGLIQGFTDGQVGERERLEKEEMRKLQIKMFKHDLDAKDRAEGARKTLVDALTNFVDPALMRGTQLLPDEIGPTRPPPAPGAGGGLSAYLKTPQGQATALNAGYSLKDLKDFQRPDITDILAKLQTGTAVQGAAETADSEYPLQGRPGEMLPGGVKFDASGNPMLDFSPAEVKRTVTSGDGKYSLGYDQFGRLITKRPVGSSERAEEDKPLLTSAKDLQDANGRSPNPNMTWREAHMAGFVPKEDKVALSDSARLSLANEGAKNLTEVIGKIAPNGKINKTLLLQMDAPMGGVGQGRELNQLIDTAISSQILLQSGVSVRPEEIANLRRTYVPTTMDLTTKGLPEKKLERFQALLEGNLDMGTLPPSIRERIEARRANKGKPADTGGTEPPKPSTPTAGGGPQVGAVVNGYKFKGGNPNDKKNWVKQ